MLINWFWGKFEVNKLIFLENFTFDKDDYKEGKPTFLDWLVEQDDRDDPIGDIAADVLRHVRKKEINVNASFKEIYIHINEIIDPDDWHINDSSQTGYEFFEKHGLKPHVPWSPRVSPLFCLKLAWDEYEEKIKRKYFLRKDKTLSTSEGFVYFIKLKDKRLKGQVKIGRSKELNSRQKALQTSLPVDNEIIGYIKHIDYKKIEKELHYRLKDKHIMREWFSLTDKEVFLLIKEYSDK